jgi:Fe2+-dicitrate sensor, membrane component
MNANQEQKMVWIAEIIARDIQGELSKDEAQARDQWLQESESNRLLYKRCLAPQNWKETAQRLDQIDSEQAYARFKVKAGIKSNPSPGILRKFLPYAAVASLALCLGLSWYLMSKNQPETSAEKILVDRSHKEKSAKITLSDGRIFELDKSASEIIVDKDSMVYANGESIASVEKIASATISTPRGSIYHVVLPDGTKVSLNAESELSYPVILAKDKREVSLVGEAYFDVTRDEKRPFIVQTKNQKVSVLGTKFAINAYESTAKTKTTLISGKVHVQPQKPDIGGLLLQPDQQSILSGTILKKYQVDAQQEIAWLNGKFNFDGKNLQEVMEELARWYDIKVIYRGNKIPNVEFFGGTFRSSKLSNILKILESQDISYELTSDNTLILQKNKLNKEGGI